MKLAGLLALVAVLAAPATLTARPQPGTQRTGFRLFARAIGAFTINRVYCGLSSTGEVCVDSTGSSTIGGGYWPKGGPNQYVFNSGMQMGGIIDTASHFKWSGDTTGAFFFDPKGTTQHGQQIQPIWNYASSTDAAAWPAAANVPSGDAEAGFFNPLLQGIPSASQGDVWTLAWDGDPSLAAGRPHPLGVMVETRGLGWNYPSGNQDILYYLYTFYNVSSTCAGDYAALRPSMQAIALAQAQIFQAKNNAAYGMTMPGCGYTIKNFYANFAADMDVSSNAGANFGSVNLPFQLGFAYQSNFNKSEGSYVLPPDAGGNPFVGGYGFVGVKYLASPDSGTAPNTGPVGLTLFSNTINGGAAFNDPQNTTQLYRYMSGNVNPALGDGNCNYNPVTDHICFIRQSGPVDIRFFQSSGPFDLKPGQASSVVVAYIFASAVKTGACPSPGCPDVVPGNPLVNTSAATLLSTGANPVDSMTGFEGYVGVTGQPVDQFKFKVVKNSLLSKALVAQAVFDSKFLLPFAPAAPDFFLVPGDNQVAIFWKKSAAEATGDLFYSIAHAPLVNGAPNQLYDPNYRLFDVEGYRIYRGRTDDPSSLKLLAQFDYNNTTFQDYQGQVNPVATCAPELGIPVDSTCGGAFDKYVPGVALTKHVDYPIVSPLVQVRLGDRVALADGTALALHADTAVTGGNSGLPELKDTGVPFVYLDKSAKNNLRYFYAVTAFDINSVNSGPSSLESPRATKSAIPVHFASNYTTAGDLQVHTGGRGVGTDTIFKNAPTLDATTGTFSGPAQPATGASLGFVGALVSQVVKQSGSMSVTVDSMVLGSAYDGIPNTYYLSIASATGTVKTTLPVTQDVFDGTVTTSGTIDGGPIDNSLAHLYGGNNTYHLGAAYTLNYPGNYFTNSQGRGCINGAIPSPCNYNGPRWFDGPSPQNNETFPHPTRGNAPNGGGPTTTNFNNAGALTGVATIYEPHGYQTMANVWRQFEGALGGAATAADYNVYWGTTPGTVDSVVDVTDNVLVPFAPDAVHGYTWGFLNQAGTATGTPFDTRTGVLTLTDFSCVQPFKGFPAVQGIIPCGGGTYTLSNTAVPGTIAFMTGAASDAQTRAPAANPGFAMYMPGHVFMFELTSATPPAKPAVWTLRTYTGGIKGGGGNVGVAGNNGSYKFYPAPSPLVAPGTSVAANYSVTNKLVSSTKGSLDAVHTVPDPYYVTNQYETSPTGKVIKFVNLPKQCIIRIYTTSGVLVRMLEHNPSTYSGEEDWDVRNRNNQVVASGVYFYSIESASGPRVVKRLTIVNFAQ